MRVPSLPRPLALAAVLLLGGATGAYAQGAEITGRVVQANVAEGIDGATVRIYGASGRLLATATSDASGRFALRGVPAGVYELLVQAFGFRAVRVDSVVVRQDAVPLGEITLEPYTAELSAVVITASRSAESLLEAPAPVQLVDARTVHERPAITVVDYLRGLTGVDIVTIGLTQHSVVGRGFNDVSSGSLFELIDYRWASIPSLRFNTYSLVPIANDDIDHVELVLGPGSALYGPNVDRGVMHIVTRSPLEDEGSVVAITGGLRGGQAGDALLDRGLVQISGRHVTHLGARAAVKVSAMYMSGNDWRHSDPQETIARQAAINDGANPDTLRIGRRSFETSRWALDGRLDAYVGERARLTVSVGRSHLDKSVELTPVGAAQGQNWSYNYLQGRLTSGDWFVQTYVNQSDAGGSYLLRDGSSIVDRSYIWVGQLQHATNVGSRQRFQYGADVVRTVPRTEGTINGTHENDDELTEFGGYLQSETDLTGAVRLVAAGRVDWHSVVGGPVFSPRAALLVRPTDFHTFRLTYNRAFSQPSTQQLFIDLSSSPSLGPFSAFGVRAAGVPAATGFSFRRDCGGGGGPCMYSPFAADPSEPLPIDAAGFWQDAVSGFETVTRQFTGQPLDPALEAELRSLDPAGSVGTVLRKLDVNSQQIGPVLDPASAVTDIAPLEPAITNTLELGFKGFLPPRIFLSVDVYATRVENFVGPLAIETPNAYLDRADLEQFLAGPLSGLGLDSTQVSQVAQGLASVPLATVSPREAPGPLTDVYITFRNFGEVELWGADLAAALPLGERLELGAGYSYISRNYFRNVDGIDDIALNAPRHKGSASVRYRTADGFSAELRGRRVGRFEVKSGVFEGTVDPYTIIDVNVDYPLPFLRQAKVTATALNLLDNRHREIVGAPQIGRMVYLRVTHAF